MGMTYSFSRLKKYFECPASFQYKYLFDMPEVITEPLVLGKTVHAAIQAYLNGTDMALAIDSAMLEAELPIERHEVEKLSNHPDVISTIGGGHIEDHFTVPLDEYGTIQFQGFIDWWNTKSDGSIHLVDWKTNRIKYSPQENHQLGLYAWYLSQVTSAKEINAELAFLRYQSAERHTYTIQEMEESRQWALNMAEEIEDKVAEWNLMSEMPEDSLFPAMPGKCCQYCGYASLCIQSVKLETLDIADSADAKKLAVEVIRLESALSDMKGNLKDWVKSNGDIAVGDAAFSFVPSVSWNIGAEKLYELCSELHDAGVDVFQYLTLTAANLKKIGVTDDKLAVYGKQKTTKTFRLVKAKEAC
jgi:CRISPR/Cas system-associated exonuclease Cas4 (RecB family)